MKSVGLFVVILQQNQCVFVHFQITWLEGHSLAQTVFTCLYVHNPDLIEEPALKAFALGILKVCDIAREKVNKAAVFEEVRITNTFIPEHRLVPLLSPALPLC